MRKTHRAQTATRPQDLAPRGLGRIAISFQAAGGTGNYFRGSGEQAHSFGDLVSTAKKQKNIYIYKISNFILKEKPPFC